MRTLARRKRREVRSRPDACRLRPSILDSRWVNPGATHGRHLRPPCPESTARKTAPWTYNSAIRLAATSAHLMGSPASAASPDFGTYPTAIAHIGEQSSYFLFSIALVGKIISS